MRLGGSPNIIPADADPVSIRWRKMRGMDAAPHRVWRYALLAWVALLAGPIVHAAMRWQMGVGRDADMSGVHELVLTFLIVLSVPMAALAFGVFAPLGVAIDSLTRGRTSRLVNVLLGATLSVPACIVTMSVVGGEMKGVLSSANLQRAMGLFAALPLAGMIVGLGLRHRRPTEHGRRPRS